MIRYRLKNIAKSNHENLKTKGLNLIYLMRFFSLLLNLAPKLNFPKKCNTKISSFICVYTLVFVYKRFFTRNEFLELKKRKKPIIV